VCVCAVWCSAWWCWCRQHGVGRTQFSAARRVVSHCHGAFQCVACACRGRQVAGAVANGVSGPLERVVSCLVRVWRGMDWRAGRGLAWRGVGEHVRGWRGAGVACGFRSHVVSCHGAGAWRCVGIQRAVVVVQAAAHFFGWLDMFCVVMRDAGRAGGACVACACLTCRVLSCAVSCGRARCVCGVARGFLLLKCLLSLVVRGVAWPWAWRWRGMEGAGVRGVWRGLAGGVVRSVAAGRLTCCVWSWRDAGVAAPTLAGVAWSPCCVGRAVLVAWGWTVLIVVCVVLLRSCQRLFSPRGTFTALPPACRSHCSTCLCRCSPVSPPDMPAPSAPHTRVSE